MLSFSPHMVISPKKTFLVILILVARFVSNKNHQCFYTAKSRNFLSWSSPLYHLNQHSWIGCLHSWSSSSNGDWDASPLEASRTRWYRPSHPCCMYPFSRVWYTSKWNWFSNFLLSWIDHFLLLSYQVTRLLPDAVGTTCGERMEKVYGAEHSHIIRVPFRTEKGMLRKWISRFEVWPYMETFTEVEHKTMKMYLKLLI